MRCYGLIRFLKMDYYAFWRHSLKIKKSVYYAKSSVRNMSVKIVWTGNSFDRITVLNEWKKSNQWKRITLDGVLILKQA